MNDVVRRRLIGLGTFSGLIYLIIAVLSFQFRYGEGHRDRPILLVLGLLGIAWCLYAAALLLIYSGRSDDRDPAARRHGIKPWRMRTVLFFSVVFRFILLGSNPIQEIDYYRYLWDGHVLLAGMNPYEYSPAEIDESGPVSSAQLKPGRLWKLTHSSGSVRTIFERVHHREVPTIYPPASQLVFAASALVTPLDAPVWAHVLVLRVILVGFDLGTLIVLARLLPCVGLPAELCLAYGWSPLVLKEFANSGHLDAIAVFFSTLAMYWLAGVPGRKSVETITTPRSFLASSFGMAALGVSILAKSYPIVILPLVTAYLIGRIGKRATVPMVILVVVVFVGYAPFVKIAQVSRLPGTHSPWTGLGTFLARWQKNDFLFMLVHENLRKPVVGLIDSCRALDQWRVRLVDQGVDPSFLATQFVMGSLVVALSMFWARRVFREPVPLRLIQAVGLVLAWGWIFSSTPHPWYLIWSIPFLVCVPRWSWFLMTGLVLIYYLRFWFEYQASPLGLDAVEASLDRFDHEVIWFEYVPFFLALITESITGRLRQKHIVPRPIW